MMNGVIALGYGIIVLAIIIGVGSVVLYNFGGAVGCQNALFPTWNSSANKCQNSSGDQVSPSSTAYTNTNYVLTQIGSTGLSGWVPAGNKIMAASREISDESPEFRLIALRGQDRSVKHSNYARETDKGFFIFDIEEKNNIQSEHLLYIK